MVYSRGLPAGRQAEGRCRPSRPRLPCVRSPERSPDRRGSEHMLYCSGTGVFGTVWG